MKIGVIRKHMDSRTLNKHNCLSSRYFLSSFSACFELLCDVITKLERRSYLAEKELFFSLSFRVPSVFSLKSSLSFLLPFFLQELTILKYKKKNNKKKRDGKVRKGKERKKGKCLFRGTGYSRVTFFFSPL